MKKLNPTITCYDGTNLSVQASEFHYSTPRDDFGPYSEIEVGFPTKVPTPFLSYAEDKETPLRTVYPYVPVVLVQDFIDSCGGILTGKLP